VGFLMLVELSLFRFHGNQMERTTHATYHTSIRLVATNGSDSVDITASTFAENGYTQIITVNVIRIIIIIIGNVLILFFTPVKANFNFLGIVINLLPLYRVLYFVFSL
jgi:hypothetical protein